MKAWWAKNKHKKKAYDSKYYSKNRAEMNDRSRKYYASNKEDRRKKMKEYIENNRDKLRPMWDRHYHKRRAKLAGVKSEPYSKQDIYHKTGGICHICTDVIDLSLKWPNSDSFSYDHIIPLSKGGDDTIENVSPSHLKCNLSKFNKILVVA